MITKEQIMNMSIKELTKSINDNIKEMKYQESTDYNILRQSVIQMVIQKYEVTNDNAFIIQNMAYGEIWIGGYFLKIHISVKGTGRYEAISKTRNKEIKCINTFKVTGIRHYLTLIDDWVNDAIVLESPLYNKHQTFNKSINNRTISLNNIGSTIEYDIDELLKKCIESTIQKYIWAIYGISPDHYTPGNIEDIKKSIPWFRDIGIPNNGEFKTWINKRYPELFSDTIRESIIDQLNTIKDKYDQTT